MAYMHYNLQYKGKLAAPNLRKDILKAIEESKELSFTEPFGEDFRKVYKANSDGSEVAFGFASVPAREGGERVSVQFFGLEKAILELKSLLAERVEGLEFK